MFDAEAAITAAERGEENSREDWLGWLRRWDRVILRGAGSFGRELAQRFLGCGLETERLEFWDLRAEQLASVCGIAVQVPYSRELDRKRTLVINCIPNGSLSGSASLAEMRSHGYTHCVSGMGLFQAMFCPISKRTGFQPGPCMTIKACNWCSCDRLVNIVRSDHLARSGPRGRPLNCSVATFAINQKCSLACTHCGQYMNSFPTAARRNIPVERVLADVDLFMSAVDAVGMVSVIGGEPFLHPHLERIVDHILTKPNFGVLGITTNGICGMPPERLARLRSPRIRIIFSDYGASLDDERRALFAHNVSNVAAAGIDHTGGTPIWSMPPTLRRQELDATRVQQMKAGCHSLSTCKTIQNGRYYPCTTTTNVHCLEVADHPGDYVGLDGHLSANELRSRILEVDDRAYYESCRYCADGGEPLASSGGQGPSERYAHLGLGPQKRAPAQHAQPVPPVSEPAVGTR
jgi:pyruvate-formate lyase-activating enzyme